MELQADTATAGTRAQTTAAGRRGSTFDAEREQLEGAISRAWARVEAACASEPDPVVRQRVSEVRRELAELEDARDRRIRTIEAAAALAARRDDRGHDLPGVGHDDEPQRATTRFPVDPSTIAR